MILDAGCFLFNLMKNNNFHSTRLVFSHARQTRVPTNVRHQNRQFAGNLLKP